MLNETPVMSNEAVAVKEQIKKKKNLHDQTLKKSVKENLSKFSL